MALLASALADSSALFAIGLAVATAVVGAIAVLVKLPGDKSNNAVTQAQGANETLAEALQAVERERDYHKSERDYWKSQYEHCRAQALELRERLANRRDG